MLTVLAWVVLVLNAIFMFSVVSGYYISDDKVAKTMLYLALVPPAMAILLSLVVLFY